MIHAAAARNRGGQRDRRKNVFVSRWTGASTAKRPTSPATRRTASAFRRTAGALSVAIEGDAVKFHAVVDEAIAEFFGDALLQRFEFVVDEFEHLAGLDVD